MTKEEFYQFCEEKRNTKGKLISLLESLPKKLTVKVYCSDTKEFVSNIYAWEEGHDHRHFIELMPEKDRPIMTVESLLVALKVCYSRYESSYQSGISVNVLNEKGQNTSNFELVAKEDGLYFIGDKPLYQYINEFNEGNEIVS